MAQIREIKNRIASVKNTQQITRAMKMVAAAKMRKAQDKMLAMRPYADRISSIIYKLTYDLFGDEHVLFKTPAEEKKVGTIVIAGDKGLCGAFNTNIVKHALKHFEEKSSSEHQLWSIGKKATSAFKKKNFEIVHSYQDVFDSLSYILANDICEQLVEKFVSGNIDGAYVVYNEFVTVMSQNPTTKKILPIDFGKLAEERREKDQKILDDPSVDAAVREVYELEPDPEVVLQRLIARLVATEVYRATLESYAAELGARMTAMDSATNNADEMIENLTMEYNRARQAGITGELLDIVGGAEGLKG
ncbi:MAG: ATP synthase F1 subunit gamma [Planctomycetota bacterium]|jgi:F-type H+-transporting ATPase subunit gamma